MAGTHPVIREVKKEGAENEEKNSLTSYEIWWLPLLNIKKTGPLDHFINLDCFKSKYSFNKYKTQT